MGENYQKKELLALMNTGVNKLCVDCNAPSPQWASVSFGTFICLECSGVHRGFGVHISFVRSITMDKWSDDQLKKMRLGGNEAFKSFIDNYGPDGGYTKGMGMVEKYNSWAATQYRDKLTAACSDPPLPWSPSPAPPSAPSRPTSAQATRKSRAGAGISNLNPSSTNSLSTSPYKDDIPQSGPGSGHEAYFERMGNTNANRPDHLPPSQGGKYSGFGSTPDPPNANTNQHPSFGLSSQSVPTFEDFQKSPLTALTKGWGLFSSAVAVAGREINESVVKPGLNKASEVAGGESGEEWKRYLAGVGSQAQVAGGWISERAVQGFESVNEVAKSKGGVDLNAQFGKLGLGGIVGSRNGGGGYGQLERAEDGVMSPHVGIGKGRDDDFFEAWDEPQSSGAAAQTKSAAVSKKNDGWGDDDAWKEF